ncbi:serine/arginine-rich splicing factor rs40 [Phtheirospermum japonicum]|uniref:Serine/arginine-rich splicing factor rs40 n=1 Tax=Phtheirospermum japonicum TaxID=374723 RepID=A0A830CR13_9LAMI|nr:serine/arginine-rich splicing factor rs40 [Phtheirospermum japonicum]
MRPIFCGNLDSDARHSDVEHLFKRYGRVEWVDLKSGFAFIYMRDERDAEDAIRNLDWIQFGRNGQRLRVEWLTLIEFDPQRDRFRKSMATNSRPSKTLFVINFDPVNTRIRNIEKHFAQYGRVSYVRMKKNFAFVEFEVLEDATRALEATHMSKFMDRVISVEYTAGYDDYKKNGYGTPNRRGLDVSRIDDHKCSPIPSRTDDDDDVSVPVSRFLCVFVCVFSLFLFFSF